MSNRLPRSTPEELKISSSAIHAFLNEVEEKGLELHSFMLLRHGAVAAEGWWAPYGPEYPHTLFSLSKSFTSTAVGLAEAEGLLSVEDRVVSYFPEWTPANPSEFLAEMRIHDLLTMNTGHDQESLDAIARNSTEPWVKLILELPVPYRPGTHFQYNSGATYMLSAIVQKVTGKTLLDYLQLRLFEPLGINHPTWDSCPQGINVGGWGLSVTTEDIAKFGQLYLQKGMWNGRRLVPEAWVERATSKQVSNGDDPDSDWTQGYGYQFWRCRHNLYRGDGMFGQYCIVLPEQQAVIAITAAAENMQAVLNVVWDTLLPAFDAAGQAQENGSLTERLRSLSLPLPQHQATSPLEVAVSGKRYILEENEAALTAVSLDFHHDHVVLTISRKDEQHITKCGRGCWLFFSTRRMDNKKQQAAASCTWKDDQTLIVTQCFVEEPYMETVEFRFEGDQLKAAVTINVGQPPVSSFTGKMSVNR